MGAESLNINPEESEPKIEVVEASETEIVVRDPETNQHWALKIAITNENVKRVFVTELPPQADE